MRHPAWTRLPDGRGPRCRYPQRVYHAPRQGLQSARRTVIGDRLVTGSRPIGGAPVSLKATIVRTGLEALYFSGAHILMRPFVSGVGAILMLHHVRPARTDRFQPNRQLEVTP